MPPTVSVCMVTYQHAAFLRQAIDGALAQQADFPLEVLIGEDGSTDGTREICLEYAQREPNRIRVFLRDRTTILPGGPPAHIARNFLMTLREARGEFIALCEGDDYWTDPSKLQRQVDYLRANPDCVGCFHDAKLVDAEGQTLRESYFQSEQEKFTRCDVLESLLSREPTCSLVFHRAALTEPLPEWYLRRPCDLYLDILLTGHGSLGFVRRNMGAYRMHAGGIWSGQREANKILELIFRYKLLLSDPAFGKHQDLLVQKLTEFQSTLFTRKDLATEIARLEQVVQEQTRTIKSMEVEYARLTSEASVAQTEAKRSSQDAQKHIDELLTQVRQLSATSLQQDKFVAILEKERNRLTALTATQAKDCEHYLNTLTAQTKAIKDMQAECDRLIALAASRAKDCEHYIKTINEQTAYIKILEAQRALTAGK